MWLRRLPIASGMEPGSEHLSWPGRYIERLRLADYYDMEQWKAQLFEYYNRRMSGLLSWYYANQPGGGPDIRRPFLTSYHRKLSHLHELHGMVQSQFL